MGKYDRLFFSWAFCIIIFHSNSKNCNTGVVPNVYKENKMITLQISVNWIVSHLLKIICWSINPWCDGVWKWGLLEIIRFRLGHEGEALIIELTIIWWDSRELPLFQPWEDTGRKQTSSRWEEKPGSCFYPYARNFQHSELWEIN